MTVVDNRSRSSRPPTQLNDAGKAVFDRLKRQLLYVFEAGFLFVALFASLLVYSIVLSQCPSSDAQTETLIFSYPLVISIGLLALGCAVEYMFPCLEDRLLWMVVCNFLPWLFVICLTNFIFAAINWLYTTGTVNNILVCLGILLATAVILAVLYLRGLRRMHDHVAMTHEVYEAYNHYPRTSSEYTYELARKTEDQYNQEHGIRTLFGLPILSTDTFLSRMRNDD